MARVHCHRRAALPVRCCRGCTRLEHIDADTTRAGLFSRTRPLACCGGAEPAAPRPGPRRKHRDRGGAGQAVRGTGRGGCLRTLSIFNVRLHLLSQGNEFDLVTREPYAGSSEAIEEELAESGSCNQPSASELLDGFTILHPRLPLHTPSSGYILQVVPRRSTSDNLDP